MPTGREKEMTDIQKVESIIKQLADFCEAMKAGAATKPQPPRTIDELCASLNALPSGESCGPFWECTFDQEPDGQGGYRETPMLECWMHVGAALYNPYSDYTEVKEGISSTGWTYEANEERYVVDSNRYDTWLCFTRDVSVSSEVE